MDDKVGGGDERGARESSPQSANKLAAAACSIS